MAPRELTVTVRALDLARVAAFVFECDVDRDVDVEAALSRLARTVEEHAPAALEVLGLEAMFRRSPDGDGDEQT